MKYEFPILAKPSGITLEQHSFDVVSEGLAVSSCQPFCCKKYNDLIGKSLTERLNVIAKYHDYGKQCDKWQSACQKDYEAFLSWKSQNHGDFTQYSKSQNGGAPNLQKAGCRHEFVSLSWAKTNKMPLLLQAAIAAHHSKLCFDDAERWECEGYKDYWKSFYKESVYITEEESLDNLVLRQYECAGLRGLLQLADHRASAKEEGDFVPDLTSFAYNFPFSEKRGVQRLVEDNWEKDLLLLRAPTGAGKTDASLLWASLQIKNNCAQRLVIAMPTRFTSNALAISVADQLSDTGLYHSSAWVNRFESDVEKGKVSLDEARAVHSYARLLQTPITVCTIDHLLMSLTLTREDFHLMTFNLANSCVVIDEADFYDDFTNANIKVLLKILRMWKVPVLIMSASLPQSAIEDYRECGYDVDSILEDTSDNARIRFEIKEIKQVNDVSDSKEVILKMLHKRNGIIYANTIDRAMEYYEYVRYLMEDENIDIPLKLYHSRFTELDKQKKEGEILQLLGRNVWGNNKANGIVIMTQIGEMSVNVSTDIMLSDICPIDRLVQRAGRLRRFNKNVGELYVVIPQKNETLYPAPYGSFDKKEKLWHSSPYLNKTIQVIKEKAYSADDLVAMINEVYCERRNYSVKADENAKKLLELFRCNWLINPAQAKNVEEDDEETMEWRSRDLEPRESVYVNKPDSCFFSSYYKFQSWSTSTAIELPLYLVKKAEECHIIETVKLIIGQREECKRIIREGFYDSEVGIKFPSNNNFL